MLLKERYQIVSVLSAGAFGQTYIALDTHRAGNPKCVVKHIKPAGEDRRYFTSLSHRVRAETETLKKLGHHEQIPTLLDCFDYAQQFYLVLELIEGHPLSEEMPLSQRCNKRWSEERVVGLLREVLTILEFVHGEGIMHSDLKPDNLIRRAGDNKLCLIDFGAAQQIDKDFEFALSGCYERPLDATKNNLENLPLGYIPAEQLTSNAKPSSDIYALGLIAILALTGLEPTQLNLDLDTREVIWKDLVPVSDKLVSIINKMVRYDFQDRYQSASDVLRSLSNMPVINQQPEKKSLTFKVPNFKLKIPKSFFVRGMGLGIAANSIVVAGGMYTLSQVSTSEGGTDVLYKATEEYQTGDLKQAIALAQSIPSTSPAYPEAQVALREWRHNWNIAAAEFMAAEKAFNEGRWLDVLQEARQIPDIYFWNQKVEVLVEQAKPNLEAEAQELLQKAYSRASLKDFSGALQYLKQIPNDTPSGVLVEQKLSEYTEKQRIKADYLLQQAYNRAELKDFTGAIRFIKQIPEGTTAYAKVKPKIAEYSEQQLLQAKSEKDTMSNATYRSGIQQQSRRREVRTIRDINPGTRLQEINAKSHM